MASTAWLGFLLFAATAHADPEVMDRGTPYNGQFDRYCSSWTDGEPTEAQKKVLGEVMGQRSHRLWHFMWHAMPRSWQKFSQEEKDFFTELSPDWIPPRVGGIDFFYMHHMMIGMLFRAFREKGLPCMKPWIQLPGMNEWPPMAGGFNPDTYAKMDRERKAIFAKEYLSGRGLQELGRMIEPNLHGRMHVNYSIVDRLPKYKDCAYNTPMLMASPLTTAFKSYCDEPQNDFLKGTETAHVNPIFFKLHGMVEMMLIDWALANGYTAGVEDELGKGCGGREGKCYKFDQDLGRAPWLGGMPKADEKGKSARDRGHEHHGDLSRFVQNGMERMAKKRLQKNWETEWRKEQAKPAQNRRSHRALRSELEKRVRDEVKREVEQKLPKVLKVMHQYSQMGDGISLLSP